MFTSRIVVLMGLLCLLAMAGSSVLAEDIYMKRVLHTDPVTVMGQVQPATDDTSEIWLAKDAAYYASADGIYLVRTDKGVMYALDDAAKTYFEIPMSVLGATKEAVDAMPPNPMAAQMGAIKVTVTPTDETKKCGDWNAKKYVLDINLGFGTSKSDVWTTKDMDVNQDILTAVSAAQMSMLPGLENIVSEMKKIEGVPVETLTDITMMGMVVKTSDKLLEYTNKTAPAGIFEIPEGYTKADIHPGMQGM